MRDKHGKLRDCRDKATLSKLGKRLYEERASEMQPKIGHTNFSYRHFNFD